jgi:putative ABC transport system permease protein
MSRVASKGPEFVHEFQLAFRRLLARPTLPAAVLLTLTISIAASTAIFTLVHRVLLRPLPYPEANQLVSVQHSAPGIQRWRAPLSWGSYLYYRRESSGFADLGVYQQAPVNLTGEGSPERIHLTLVSYTLFSTLRVSPLHGRSFTADDDRPGADPVVIVSNGLWRRRYGADPGLLGRSLRINDRNREVVGIMGPEFGFPNRETDLWVPMRLDPSEASLLEFDLDAIGRLKPGVTPSQAEAGLQQLVPGLSALYADASPSFLSASGLRAIVVPLKDEIVGGIRPLLRLLFVGIALLLLVACSNIAGLFLARTEERRRELTLRAVFGADRRALIQNVLSEAILLSLAAGALGLFLASAFLRVLAHWPALDLPRTEEVRLDVVVVLFTLAVALTSSLLCTTLSLTRLWRLEPTAALRGESLGGGAAPERAMTRRLLATLQIAIATALLCGAGLLLRSLAELRRIDPGFNAQSVQTMELVLPYRMYPDYPSAWRFYNELLRQIRALPGVKAAGAVSALPLTSPEATEISSVLEIQDLGAARDDTPVRAKVKLATRGYFEALDIPIITGAWPTANLPSDDFRVVVDQTLAEGLFSDDQPLGRRVRRRIESNSSAEARPWARITTVVGPVRDVALSQPPSPTLYLPLLDRPPDSSLVPRGMTLVIRSGLPPESLVKSVRSLVGQLDSELPLFKVRSLDSILRDSMVRLRFSAFLLTLAACCAVLLSTIAVYSLLAFAVRSRWHEIGVRLALGARRSDILHILSRQGLLAVLPGLAVGLAGAMAMSRALASLLYGVKPSDLPTLTLAALLLVAISALATYLPLRRASRVDPVETLKSSP